MSDEPKRPVVVQRARWFQLTEASSIGIEMAAAIGVGVFLGRWFERNVTHWAPGTTFVGLAIGIAAAAFAVVRTARNFSRVIADEEAREAAAAQVQDAEHARRRDQAEAHSHSLAEDDIGELRDSAPEGRRP